MKLRVQVVIETEDGAPELITEVACVERDALRPETLGLTLAEGKRLLHGVQHVLVPCQVAAYVDQQRYCPDCGQPRTRKGRHDLVVRSLFGRLQVSSPRFYTCSCQPRHAESVSPLAELFPERTTPELQYLAVKAAASESFERTVAWLEEVLPTVRNLPLYLYPEAEYLLDWFHITMRVTTMNQTAKGLRARGNPSLATDLEEEFERLKWFLWHGNVFCALQVLESLEFDLEGLEGTVDARKLLKVVREFESYIRVNRSFIPNFGERYRYGETISTAFVESTVNQVMSKRMAKKQQMRWTRSGAHRLLQVRTQVLDGILHATFCCWYPAMTQDGEAMPKVA